MCICAAVGVFALVTGIFSPPDTVRAGDVVVSRAATADAIAERIVVEPEGLLFPIDSSPVCLVFNNFGGYSKVSGGSGHQGVDIGSALGQEVYAVESGVLYRQWTDPADSAAGNGWGLDGDSSAMYRYYHLDRFADGVALGDRVDRGQVIGYVGDTGNATPSGWHLHFEVRPGPDHTPVDPVPLLGIPTDCTVYNP